MDTGNRQTAVISYKHKLSTQEILAAGEQIGMLDEVADRLECDRKTAASGFKAKLDENEQQRKRLSRSILSGTEERVGECEVDYDYGEGVVNFIELITRETVYSRPMTSEERQLNLFSNEPMELKKPKMRGKLREEEVA